MTIRSAFTAVAVLLALHALPQSLFVERHFDMPQVQPAHEGYHNLILDNCINYANEGDPLLPYHSVQLLLPPGKEIKEIIIKQIDYLEYPDHILVQPAGRQFHVGEYIDPQYKPIPNPNIYLSPDPYPNPIINDIHTQFLSGHPIGSFSISPVVFLPVEKRIKVLSEIKLEIVLKSTSRAEAAQVNLRTDKNTIDRLIGIIDNDELTDAITPVSTSGNSGVDLLIISSEDLKNGFNALVNYKTEVGFAVELLTTAEIFSTYPGRDRQEKIRNVIKSYYQNKGISYVILGGDSDPGNGANDIIPHRGLSAFNENDIPSDMYYACLDGSWNDDNDLLWGEAEEYDLYAEVAVGRLSVNDLAELENFIAKIIKYQDSPVVNDIEKALFAGEILNQNPLTYGADYMNELVSGSNNHGISTVGVSDNFTKHKLYDKDNVWDKSMIYDYFSNKGLNLINHNGHANAATSMKLENSDITLANFTNDGINFGFPIEYTQGCYSGSFDNRRSNGIYMQQDCIIEKLTNLQTGEVAALANSRNGWIAPGNTNSYSQYLHRQFIDAVFGENISNIGPANNRSKEENATYFESDAFMRYVAYGMNLFGDPSLDIWTAIPTDIIANYPVSIPMGTETIDFDTDCPGARIGLMQSGDQVGRGVTDEYGNATVELYSPVVNGDPIQVFITAHNRNRYSGSVNIENSSAYVSYLEHTIDDEGIPNGAIDYGETIRLSIGMTNVGNATADNVTVFLSISDPYVSLIDSTELYGDFNPAETKTRYNAFELEISDSIPDGHLIEFKLRASGSDQWYSLFEEVALAPAFRIKKFIIDDYSGNNNGFLDPGELAKIKYLVKNTGHSKSMDTKAELKGNNGFLQVMNSLIEIGSIEAGESTRAVFEVGVEPYIPIGSFEEFDFSLTAGYYTAKKVSDVKIGHVIEDFETGNFQSFNWLTGGDANWNICHRKKYEGVYSAKSGEIGPDEFTELNIRLTVTTDDSISFYVKTSSEPRYDLLEFFIQNNPYGRFSGETNWKRVAYFVSAGNRSFKWRYKKDKYIDEGEDCAWIDYIDLPVSDEIVIIKERTGPVEGQSNLTNFPNPFKSSTSIGFNLDQDSKVSVDIYTINGDKVATILHTEKLNVGYHEINWNVINTLPAGIYVCRLQTEVLSVFRKMILTR